MSTREQDLARLDAALAEELGEARAPDYRHLLRRRRPTSPWWAAALVLLGATVVLLLWRQLSDPEAGPKPEAATPQDPPAALEVKDLATFRVLCGKLRGIRIKVVQGENGSFRYSYPGYEPRWYPAALDLAALRKELLACPHPQGLEVRKAAWSHFISLDLEGGRRMEVALRPLGGGQPHLLNVRGMPALQASAPLVEMLKAQLRAVEAKTKVASGVYNKPMLDLRIKREGKDFAPRRLRLVGANSRWLDSLAGTGARDSLEILDLRDFGSPVLPLGMKANLAARRRAEIAAMLAKLARSPIDLAPLARFKALRRLYLRGTSIDAAGFRALGQLQGLEELHILMPYEDPTKNNTFAGAIRHLDGDALQSLRGLRQMQVFHAPGAALKDEDLLRAQLGKAWPALRVLNLSRSPHLRGHGMETFAGHRSLARVLLCDLPEISDTGIETLSRLPALKHLDLSNLPSPLDLRSPGGVLRSPALLRHLAKLPQLEVLRLDHWFCSSKPGDRFTAKALRVGQHPVGLLPGPVVKPVGRPAPPKPGKLTAPWRAALHELLTRQHLQLISLRSCHDLSAEDFAGLDPIPRIRQIDLHACQHLDGPTLNRLRAQLGTEIRGPR